MPLKSYMAMIRKLPSQALTRLARIRRKVEYIWRGNLVSRQSWLARDSPLNTYVFATIKQASRSCSPLPPPTAYCVVSSYLVDSVDIDMKSDL